MTSSFPSGKHRATAVRVALLLLCAIFFFTVAPLGGQQRPGEVFGRVAGEGGGPLGGVEVTVLAPEGDAVRGRSLSGEDGGFRVGGLVPGPVRVRAERTGFQPQERAAEVAPGARVRLDFRLSPDAVLIEELTVLGRRNTERERTRFETEAGVTARVISGEDLKILPGLAEADVMRAVEVLPGVISTSDFSSAFNVRGGSADQNLILLDGFPIFNPFHLGGLFSVFNSDVIARAELLAGGFGAEYGGRVSSVLSVESETGAGEGLHGEGGVSLLASRLALHSDLPDGVGTVLGGEGGSWFLSGRRSYFDQVLRPVTDFPYHLTDVQGGLTLGTPGGGRLRLIGYTGRDVLDLSDFTPPGAEDEEESILRIQWDWGNDVLGLRWEQPWGAWIADGRVGYSRFGEELGFVDFGDTEFISRIEQWSLRGDLARPLGPTLDLKVGAEANRMAYRNRAESGGAKFFGNGDDGVLGAAFGQFRWRLSERWIAEAGVRADGWWADSSTHAFLSPRLALKRFFGRERDAAAKLALGRYVQFLHSLRDENLPVSNDRWTLANATVPPVVSDQLQLGVEKFWGDRWYASAEAYARTFRGVTDLNYADDPNTPADDLLEGEGLSYGLDFLVRRSSGPLTGWTTISLLRAERTFPDPNALGIDDIDPTTTFAPIFDRRLDVELVLQAQLPWELESGLRWNFGSGLPYTRAVGQHFGWEYDISDAEWEPSDFGFGGDAPLFAVLGRRNAERYPAYHRLDVTLRRTFERRWGSFTPYLQVLNVYNQRNVLFYFYNYNGPEPTRSGFSMFPVLPAVGVEVSF